MRTPVRRADEHLRWLRANGHGLGALTGTDHRALEAIDRCWELYAHTGSERVLAAVAGLIGEMQPSTRFFARELIARAMDWGDRDRLWPLVVDVREAA